MNYAPRDLRVKRKRPHAKAKVFDWDNLKYPFLWMRRKLRRPSGKVGRRPKSPYGAGTCVEVFLPRQIFEVLRDFCGRRNIPISRAISGFVLDGLLAVPEFASDLERRRKALLPPPEVFDVFDWSTLDSLKPEETLGEEVDSDLSKLFDETPLAEQKTTDKHFDETENDDCHNQRTRDEEQQ